MASDLCRVLERIEGGRDRHLKLGSEILRADQGSFFPVDFLAIAALNRSLSNCEAFVQLARTRNYLVAASLVRLQLDTFLRFYAAFLVSDPHDFANAVLGGTAVRKLKDRSGSPMTDKFLHESAAKEFPWISRVYDETSGFIHLSDKHILSTLDKVEDSGRMTIQIGADSSRFTGELWVEVADGFVGATEALFMYLEGWAVSKANPQLLKRAPQQISAAQEDA